MALSLVILWMSEASLGIVNPSGRMMTDRFLTSLASMSWTSHASWTIRGQLSTSLMGAFQSFGRPVVSVSKKMTAGVFMI